MSECVADARRNWLAFIGMVFCCCTQMALSPGLNAQEPAPLLGGRPSRQLEPMQPPQAPPPAPYDLRSVVERLQAAEARIDELSAENKAAAEAVEAAKKKAADEKRAAAAKEKKWYDKMSLRGYAQFRYNYITHTEDGSAPPQHAGDSSIGDNQEFLIRRARLIFSSNVSDHLFVYLQPDFASTPDGSVDNIYFTQIRDWYADVYLDDCKEHRLRIGQSKVPYGWENLQSSQNRLYLDRNDAFNSATRNERDLGVFYYWTPLWAQDLFKSLVDDNLKGSGNYGLFGFGAYNGQGGSLREQNDELHLISRFTLPYTFDNGQICETGIQGYTGRYVVLGSNINPLGVGPAVTPANTRNTGGEEGVLDQRLGGTFIWYPQPLGFQTEWTVGRGPALDETQTMVEQRSLYGGYLMMNAKLDARQYGIVFPFARWQYYQGGYKSARNAPYSLIDEWNIGVEWQIRKEIEFVVEYCITDRTNLSAQSSGESYRQFVGDVLRFQFQANY